MKSGIVSFFVVVVLSGGMGCSKGGGGPSTALPTPTDVTVEAVSYSQLDLGFPPVDGAVEYKIYRDAYGAGEQLATSTGTTYSDMSAPFSTEICYTVSAINAAGEESPQSEEVCKTTPAAPSGIIATWAGTSLQGFNGNGRKRVASSFYNPVKLAFAPDGRTYVFDWNNSLMRRLELDGRFQTIIGTGFPGDWPCQNFEDPGDCEVPLDGMMTGTGLNINHWVDLAFRPDTTNGVGYTIDFAAWHNHKITHYDPSKEMNNITIVSGNGKRGFNLTDAGGVVTSGDIPHPAADAYMDFPSAVLVDKYGNLFVSAQRSNRVRRIAPDSERTVITVAGASVPATTLGYGGDGGPATLALFALAPYTVEAGLDNPEVGARLAMDDVTGRLYITDTSNNCIRVVEPGLDGVIGDGDPAEEVVTRVAGICGETEGGYVNGPALEARFSYPSDIELGPDGRLYVADTYNHVVRAIDLSSGEVSTVAGTGEVGFFGDGGPATSAMLRRPFGLAFDAAGNLYIADTANNRIRIVAK